ncbi:hypothetical protein [Clostridium butyricum]|uniref:hypothetical protein n=1 Tax=Clostridium butyricum TaxID=1492 RepID=UPI00374E936C
MDFTKITSAKQFEEIRNLQNAREIMSRSGLEEVVNKLKEEGKEDYTIFSIQNENDGWPSYLTYGIRRVNNIGYYVLEGNFTLEEDLDL